MLKIFVSVEYYARTPWYAKNSNFLRRFVNTTQSDSFKKGKKEITKISFNFVFNNKSKKFHKHISSGVENIIFYNFELLNSCFICSENGNR